MAVTILIPAPLRRYTGGAREVLVSAKTLDSALEQLVLQHADLKPQLFDEAGQLRKFVNLFVGDQSFRDLAPEGEKVPIKDGEIITLVPAIAGGADSQLSNREILRYSRHLLMPEVQLAGQLRLKKARVLCIGAGGLGSPLSLYLAASGVGTIGLADFDKVDLTNLQRQILYSTADVGRPKVEAAKERLLGLNPEIEVVAHSVEIADWNVMDLVGQYDIIADGSDNYPTRYVVNDACVLQGKPNVSASIFRFDGQLSVFAAKDGPCYRCVFPEAPPAGLVPSCAEGGVLGVIPGIVGSMQALEVLKLVVGTGEPLIGRLALLDGQDFRVREVKIRKNPRCAVCGTAPTITAPVQTENQCEEESDPTGVPMITVEDLRSKMESASPFRLLDVREAHEFEIVHLPKAQLLPLGDLPARLHELDTTQSYVIACHHGTRSVQAFRLLRAAGFGRLSVLQGGVDAWAERIDLSLPRY